MPRATGLRSIATDHHLIPYLAVRNAGNGDFDHEIWTWLIHCAWYVGSLLDTKRATSPDLPVAGAAGS